MSSISSSKLAALPNLLDVDGTPLSAESVDEKLRNKRVAYYFSAGWYVVIAIAIVIVIVICNQIGLAFRKDLFSHTGHFLFASSALFPPFYTNILYYY
jgi:hypothetical protein